MQKAITSLVLELRNAIAVPTKHLTSKSHKNMQQALNLLFSAFSTQIYNIKKWACLLIMIGKIHNSTNSKIPHSILVKIFTLQEKKKGTKRK